MDFWILSAAICGLLFGGLLLFHFKPWLAIRPTPIPTVQKENTVSKEASAVGQQLRELLTQVESGAVPDESLKELAEATVKVQESIPKQVETGIVSHKFFGSRFLFGKRAVVSGLSSEHHLLEVSTAGSLSIDGTPYSVNPGTVRGIYDELVKLRN